jgi:Ca2+/Na+ antiporter
MDLDSLKEESKKISAPEIGAGKAKMNEKRIDDLIAMLRKGDEKERKNLRRGLPFFIIAAILFGLAAAVVILSPEGSVSRSALVLRAALLVIFVYIALALAKKLREADRIDYAEPVRSFLDKAEKRYAYSPIFSSLHSAITVVVFTLLLGYGALLVIRDVLLRYFDVVDPLVGVGVTIAFFLPVYAFGLWATRKDWKKERKETWLRIRKMREEVDREEVNGMP